MNPIIIALIVGSAGILLFTVACCYIAHTDFDPLNPRKSNVSRRK